MELIEQVIWESRVHSWQLAKYSYRVSHIMYMLVLGAILITIFPSQGSGGTEYKCEMYAVKQYLATCIKY